MPNSKGPASVYYQGHFLLMVLVCMLLLVGMVEGKWRAIYYDHLIPEEVLYSVRSDAQAKLIPGFYFPPEHDTDSTLTSGFVVPLQLLPSSAPEPKDRKLFVWRKKLEPSLGVKKDTTVITHRIYTRNVRRVKIEIGNVRECSKEWLISFEGYQLPSSSQVSKWQCSKGIDALHKINIISFFVEPEDSSEDPLLTLGEFTVGNDNEKVRECRHPFLSDLLGEVRSSYKENTLPHNDPGFPLLLATESYRRKNMSSKIYFVDDGNGESERDLLVRLFYQILEHYPFYLERDLRKAEIVAKFEALLAEVDDLGSVDMLAVRLASFVKDEFQDGHFYVEPANLVKKRTYRGPIRLFEINDKIRIAAVFDTSLADILRLGHEVVAFDGRPIGTIVDSLEKKQYGTRSRRRVMAVAHALSKRENGPSIVSIRTPENEIHDVKIRYDVGYKIPHNFKAPHCHFEILDNGIAYFRIRRWTTGVLIRLLNHWEELVRAPSLVLDLRGNAGGDTLEAIWVYSLFIDRPSVYLDEVVYGSHGRLESLVVAPNRAHYFDKPVAILSDEKTACASENFIQAMKQKEKIFHLGTSRTAGALMDRHLLTFPSGLRITVDCLGNKPVWEEAVVEEIGLAPDIWVQRTRVQDLIPYEDLLLRMTQRFLSRMPTDNGQGGGKFLSSRVVLLRLPQLLHQPQHGFGKEGGISDRTRRCLGVVCIDSEF